MNNKELKYLIKPISIFVAVIALICVVISIGYSQISLIYSKVSELKDTETKLATKLDVLESVESMLSQDINFIDIALPSRSSIIYGLAQVKKIASQNSVVISNLKAGSLILEDGGISKYSINFDAEGQDGDLQKFLMSFYNSLPIMSLDKVKIDKTSSLTRSTVSLYVYFADLPEKIPAISEPVNGLSASEIEMLNELSSYIQPDFFDPKPNSSESRTNPFN
jgi:hypothetical protein